jgi:7-carboxy-7-deazaguanine synthase
MNSQPTEHRTREETPANDLERTLDVQAIFPTVQGEGPFSGEPAVFLRLAGCNLQCPMCDTDYTSQRTIMPVEKIGPAVIGAHPSRGRYRSKLLVITGGEPFRQNFAHFAGRMLLAGWRVQIETNGTMAPHPAFFNPAVIAPEDRHLITVVCSPKLAMLHSAVRDVMRWSKDSAFKYVLNYDSVDKSDGLPILALGHSLGQGKRVARPFNGFDGPVFVQPADTGDKLENEMNLAACYDSATNFGYRVGIQLHKVLGVE